MPPPLNQQQQESAEHSPKGRITTVRGAKATSRPEEPEQQLAPDATSKTTTSSCAPIDGSSVKREAKDVEAIDRNEQTDPTAVEDSCFGLRTGDQLFVGVLIAASFVLMLIHWIRLSDWGAHPVEIERHASYRYDYKLDINEATWVEWTNLQGIGETLARRIVEEREQNGPYDSVDDLQRVKGIGPKTVEKIRPWLLAPEPKRWFVALAS